MTIEQRKDNTYFDQTGKQIIVGDLLKIFHFRSNNRNYYMYHVVVMEETNGFEVMACKNYFADKPHYRLFVLANNEQRVYHDAKIISTHNHQTKRLKIKTQPL